MKFTNLFILENNIDANESGCDFVCDNFPEARKHAKDVHGIQQFLPYKCRYCDKSVRGPVCFYVKHIKDKHSSDPSDWTCSKCQKVFKFGNTMRSHEKFCGQG